MMDFHACPCFYSLETSHAQYGMSSRGCLLHNNYQTHVHEGVGVGQFTTTCKNANRSFALAISHWVTPKIVGALSRSPRVLSTLTCIKPPATHSLWQPLRVTKPVVKGGSNQTSLGTWSLCHSAWSGSHAINSTRCYSWHTSK